MTSKRSSKCRLRFRIQDHITPCLTCLLPAIQVTLVMETGPNAVNRPMFVPLWRDVPSVSPVRQRHGAGVPGILRPLRPSAEGWRGLRRARIADRT